MDHDLKGARGGRLQLVMPSSLKGRKSTRSPRLSAVRSSGSSVRPSACVSEVRIPDPAWGNLRAQCWPSSPVIRLARSHSRRSGFFFRSKSTGTRYNTGGLIAN